MDEKPFVIAIAAVSGGGKTTLTEQLLERLAHAQALYFDDYDFEESPEDICDWVERGADYNEWNLTSFRHDIELYLQDAELRYLILDYPFAYLNNDIREFIDLTVFIDTPLDIAVARRILRDYNYRSMDDLRHELANYLSRGRDAYLEMLRSVKPNSDIVIDGTQSTTEMVDRILHALQ
ncbi:hypothetical protein [Paenibacillus lignilyticus]|uniref:Phosphoribulokinase/uridine kinase domain-containing protein n=1 Tax=Paenibacillus lignilyticus TaxID=1172615 RepID=A0ABS5CAG8_9BACL|nr:hypothetical protein [Paenibacillus lignilyticus]MBP3962682.1 hypothetical protein [Paenibacillus lignilyticus]